MLLQLNLKFDSQETYFFDALNFLIGKLGDNFR